MTSYLDEIANISEQSKAILERSEALLVRAEALVERLDAKVAPEAEDDLALLEEQNKKYRALLGQASDEIRRWKDEVADLRRDAVGSLLKR